MNEYRNSKGQFLKNSVPHNKGAGMTTAERALARKRTLEKYSSKPETKQRVAKWHKENAERVAQIKKKYADSDRGKQIRRSNSHRRIARERNLQFSVNWEYFNWLCNAVDYRCLGCGKKCEELTLDHQLPINRGGDNQEWNLMPLCKSCNSRKQDRLMFVDNLVLDMAYATWLSIK